MGSFLKYRIFFKSQIFLKKTSGFDKLRNTVWQKQVKILQVKMLAVRVTRAPGRYIFPSFFWHDREEDF